MTVQGFVMWLLLLFKYYHRSHYVVVIARLPVVTDTDSQTVARLKTCCTSINGYRHRQQECWQLMVHVASHAVTMCCI